MKKRWMVVASIAGIAWLAIGVWSLLSWSTWDSGDTSSFVVQQVWDGWWLQAWGEMPISTGQYSWIICGNGKVEWWEQCEWTWKCEYLISFPWWWAGSVPWLCNPNTCMCEQQPPVTGCFYALDIIPSSNILKHDAGNWNFGWTYRLKPGSSTFDCEWEVEHIFINGRSRDSNSYTLPLWFNWSLYCGPTTGWCYFDIKVSTGSTGTTCQDLKVGAGVRFVPWTSNNPKFWWTIYTKVGKRSIDCPSNPNTNNIKIYFSPRWSRDFKPTWPLNVNFEVWFEAWTYKLECGEDISYWSWSAGYAISCEYQVVIEQSKIGTGKTVTWVDMKNPGM